MKTIDSLIAERDDADHRADYAEACLAEAEDKIETLLAALKLVRSMPVVEAKDRLGYDCSGCGAPLGKPHLDNCAWYRAMRLMHPESAAQGSET